MNKLLPLLINRAEIARDRQAALAREAANAALQTQATLVRLEDFRGESLDRSPASLGSHADAQALGDYQRFVSRLDDAIAMQRQECQRREERSAAGQQRLIEEQRKLMAFETLLRRRAAAPASSRAAARKATPMNLRHAPRATTRGDPHDTCLQRCPCRTPKIRCATRRRQGWREQFRRADGQAGAAS